MSFKEFHLRDSLKNNLQLIEPGLTLVGDEYYVRNNDGTSGYIDILAKDAEQNLVIIEIKISKHSEREAITELMKYVALLRKTMSVKDSEMRLIVVSTDWRELHTPMSEFAHNTDYNASGLKAECDENGGLISLSRIEFHEPVIGRELVPRHWLYVYEDKDNRDARCIEYESEILRRGIKNFILVKITFKNKYASGFAFYFAQQKESLEFFKTTTEKVSVERYLELKEATLAYSPGDTLNEFADAAVDMMNVQADEMEIGHPEKFKGYYEIGEWKIEKILRYGTLASDVRLTDEALIRDLCGYTGGSYTWYQATCKSTNKAHLNEIKEKFSGCLEHNEKWRHSLQDIIAYSERNGPFTFHLSIFNPEDVIGTVAFIEHTKNSRYEPNFVFILDRGGSFPLEIFKGQILGSSTKTPNLSKIFRQHFPKRGAPDYLMTCHFHGIYSMNAEIMKGLGLEYSVMHYKISDISQLPDSLIFDVKIKSGGVSGKQQAVGLDLESWMKHNKEFSKRCESVYAQSTNFFTIRDDTTEF